MNFSLISGKEKKKNQRYKLLRIHSNFSSTKSSYYIFLIIDENSMYSLLLTRNNLFYIMKMKMFKGYKNLKG